MTDPIRFSNLKKMAQSPAHYRAAVEAPGSFDSPSMRLGRHVHALVLDPTSAPLVFDGDRRGKAWSEFRATYPDREIATTSEADKAEAIAASVFADPTARALVVGEGYVLEQRIDWTCAGRAFRSTPDAITRDGLIVDLKTSIDASIRGFQRRAWNFSYHAQLACYREAVRSTGRAVTGAVLIAVETSEPYAVTVHRLSDRVLSEGDRLWRSWFDRLLVCEASDHWPGYADDAVSFDLPEWVEIEDEGNGDENR